MMRWCAACVILTAITASALADPPDQASRRARAQQQTRWMAEQLVAGVLDIQIQQLKENGLQQLPVYIDIVAMRANLSRLTEQQMRAVLASLAEAQRATEPRRTQLLQSARHQAREVVTVLLAERDRLRRRMRVARLAAELQQLIIMQTGTLGQSRELRDIEPDRRERELLSVMEDQRDNHVVFSQLLASLNAVSKWGGKTGASAVSCLQVLTERHVEDQYREAEQLLAATELTGAVASQQGIVTDLRAALQRLRDALGVEELNPYVKSLQARQLADQQRQLRQETEAAELNESEVADELSQRQKEIHEEIAALKESLADLPRQRNLAETAEKAAYEAEGQLFQADQEAALSSQQQAIERLEALADALDGSDQADSLSDADDEAASEWNQLQQLDRDLESLQQQQSEVVDKAADQPESAATLQQQVAEQLGKAAERPLSQQVQQSVESAARAARQANEAMRDKLPAARQERTAAAEQTKEAIDQARELAQARMEELAPSSPPALADLVQAAEDLERAARAEQQLAELAAADQLDDRRLAERIEAQSQATGTVREVAQEIQPSAPSISQQLGNIEASMQEVGRSLRSMQQDEEVPGQHAEAVAQSADKNATGLLEMASQLRQQVAGSEPNNESSAENASADPSQTAQNQGAPEGADGQSPSQGESQPTETNSMAPAESGNRLTSDQGRVREGTVAEARRALQDSPWFAKLPPALRESIRARTRRRPPRGYEERLRRYFESVDKR